jgi:hypothetical protein
VPFTNKSAQSLLLQRFSDLLAHVMCMYVHTPFKSVLRRRSARSYLRALLTDLRTSLFQEDMAQIPIQIGMQSVMERGLSGAIRLLVRPFGRSTDGQIASSHLLLMPLGQVKRLVDLRGKFVDFSSCDFSGCASWPSSEASFGAVAAQSASSSSSHPQALASLRTPVSQSPNMSTSSGREPSPPTISRLIKIRGLPSCANCGKLANG